MVPFDRTGLRAARSCGRVRTVKGSEMAKKRVGRPTTKPNTKPRVQPTPRWVTTVEKLEADWWAHQLGRRPGRAPSSKRNARPEPDEATLEATDSSAVEAEPKQPPAFRTADPIVGAGGQVEVRPRASGAGGHRALKVEPRETILTQLANQVNAIRYARQSRYATARHVLGYLLICLGAILVGWLVVKGMQ
jgi:hypothetical protein